MYKFGKNAPRSLESFGVAGLIEENGYVFYDSLYSPKHIGRVSDLLSARLQSAGADEFKLRTLLLYSMFEAYRAQISQEGAWDLSTAKNLGEPLVIEVGVDSEKIAVGVAFTYPGSSDQKDEGLIQRLKELKPSNEFEKTLVALREYSDRLILRAVPGSKRYEIVALLGLPGKIDLAKKEGDDLEVVLMDQVPEQSPEVKNYQELGDLDYPNLLKDQLKTGKNSVSGEFLAKISSPDELEDGKTIVSGSNPEKDDSKKVISGTTNKIKDETIVVKGGEEKEKGSKWNVVQGAAPAPVVNDEQLAAKIKLYQEQNQQLQARIAELEKELDKAKTVKVSPSITGQDDKGVKESNATDSQDDEDLEGEESADNAEESDEENDEEEEKGFIKKLFKKPKFFKKMKIFGKKDDEEEVDEEEQSEEESTEGSSDELQLATSIDSKDSDKDEDESSASDPVDIQIASKSLMLEIQAGGFTRIIEGVQRDATAMKSEFKSSKSKAWIETLMKEMVLQRSKLQEMVKKLNRGVRQKELEFQTKEAALKEELKRKDEMVRQKNAAVSRVKDQLTNATANIEKLQKSVQSGTTDAQFKTKYAYATKMLDAANEKNKALEKQVNDLKNSLAMARQNAVSQQSQQVHEMKKKAEKFQKMAEDYKRNNKSLMEKLEAAETKNSTAGAPKISGDMKARLDEVSKVAAERRQEIEKLKLRIEELEHEKIRLARELNQKKPNNNAGGDQGGAAPAA